MIVELVVKIGIVCTGIAALMGLTGCAVFNPGGFEFGAKAGMYAIDEQHNESRTYKERKPLICSVWSSMQMCRNNAEEGAIHGS
jgi:hypothetical protein